MPRVFWYSNKNQIQEQTVDVLKLNQEIYPKYFQILKVCFEKQHKMVGSEPTLSQADLMGLPATLDFKDRLYILPTQPTNDDALSLLSKHTHQVVTTCDKTG